VGSGRGAEAIPLYIHPSLFFSSLIKKRKTSPASPAPPHFPLCRKSFCAGDPSKKIARKIARNHPHVLFDFKHLLFLHLDVLALWRVQKKAAHRVFPAVTTQFFQW
jgi:hypothetical protein